MNIIDYFVLGVFAVFMLSGIYKGFVNKLLSIGAFIVSWALGMALMGAGAGAVKANVKLYNMMLYYTEGSEYIINNVGVEEARASISSLSSAELNNIITQANVPYPMGKEITKNIAKESFAAQNVVTLGDYFNQTIVCVFINILVFLVLFMLVRVVLSFIIEGVDYAWVLPQLRGGDSVLGGALGLLEGILFMFLIFMLLPIFLTVLGQFDVVADLIDESFFAPFFYKSNFLLSLIPGT